MNIRLTKSQKIKILNSEDIYNVMQQILLRENKIRRGQEHFWVVGLDGQNKILFIELIGLGAQNRVNANPPDVFRMAIYKLATSVVLVHNHPGGTIKPSATDTDFTDKLLKVGGLISIDVVDHLIITEKKYTSYTDLGLMEKLRKSPFYQIFDKDKADMHNLRLEIEKDEATKKAKAQSKINIAKKMKSKGYTDQQIKELTGLKFIDIKKLQ
ncbi:MAG: DNA repair protein [Chitinophagaceae bacterium]|nr:DNA repair protein [Chitinophagaceae bacterium]